jgi:hypothetical protein
MSRNNLAAAYQAAGRLGEAIALSFRTAILSVAESADLDSLGPGFSWSEVTRTTGDDFLPPQPSVSRIVKVVPPWQGLTGSLPASRSSAA